MHIGDTVADFTLADQYGEQQSLSRYLEDASVVLFFYPVALSKGCTMESCHFRDLGAGFAALGAQRIGISTDSVDKQRKFSDLHGFDYPLLADIEGMVSRQFGVKRSFGPIPVKRWTFVIDQQAHLVEIIKSEIKMDAHADRAIEVLRQINTLK
jgi:peroxiredoxin Q/BCP